MAILETHDIGKRYGRRTWALRHVDLEVPDGSITALVGPNGSGKSTLLKAWVGFEPPTEGHLTVDGIDPWKDRAGAIARVGYVPQAPSLYRELTVDEHVRMAKTLRPSFEPAIARRRLDDLDIPLSSLADELSGGQQAQVGLALALGVRAPVLLLDEPLASLDPLARREFLHVLVDAVRADGSTALLSSHVITDIEQACDRLLVLGAGKTLLDLSIAGAIAEHRVIDAADVPPGSAPIAGLVGSFPGPAGERLSLVRGDASAGGRPATLEEVVLGHLAAGRPARATAACDRARGMRGERFDWFRLTLRLHRFEVFAFGVAIIALVDRRIRRGRLHRWLPPTTRMRDDRRRGPGQLRARLSTARGGSSDRRSGQLAAAARDLRDGPVPGRPGHRPRTRAWHGPPRLVAHPVTLALVPRPPAAHPPHRAGPDLRGRAGVGSHVRGEQPWARHLERFDGFGARGGLLAARALFVFAVAVFVGSFIGRALPAVIVAALVATIGLTGGINAHERILRGEAVVVPVDVSGVGDTSPKPGDKYIDQKFVLPDGTLVGYDYFFDNNQGDAFDENGNPKYPMVNLVIPGERYRFVEAREAAVLIGGSLVALLLAGFVVARRRPG